MGALTLWEAKEAFSGSSILYLTPLMQETLVLLPFSSSNVPKVIECLAPLSPSVKRTLCNLTVFMGQTMTLDQYVNSLICSCFY